MKYEIPYQGSKLKIAEWVISNLPSADVFVDLFAGGGAVTHCALMSGKYAYVLANDLDDRSITFKRAVEGDFKDYYDVPTREEFNDSSDFVLKLLYSFGNNCRDYLWSESLEPVKVAASKMLSAPSLHERRMCYFVFLRELGVYLNDVQGLQGLEGLERLERLIISKKDYRNVSIPENSIVYAGQPCKNTTQYNIPFDYDDFETWLDETTYPVIVSEYTCPKNCIEIASLQRTSPFSATDNSKKVIERLFIQERFLHEYRKRIGLCEL